MKKSMLKSVRESGVSSHCVLRPVLAALCDIRIKHRGFFVSDRIPINRSLWKKPTYQGHYDDRAEFYEGIRCRCAKCEASFVFTADEQRDGFEVDGKYPGWAPSLCQKCNSLWGDAEDKEKAYSDNWAQKGRSIVPLEPFLREWLSAALEANSYHKKGYEHTIGMFKNILGEADGGRA